MPLVSRTRATLRNAEFGFLGVVVYTRVQTPRRWGEPFRAGVFVLPILSCRSLRTSCWIVGMRPAISSVVSGCRASSWVVLVMLLLLHRSPRLGVSHPARRPAWNIPVWTVWPGPARRQWPGPRAGPLTDRPLAGTGQGPDRSGHGHQRYSRGSKGSKSPESPAADRTICISRGPGD